MQKFYQNQFLLVKRLKHLRLLLVSKFKLYTKHLVVQSKRDLLRLFVLLKLRYRRWVSKLKLIGFRFGIRLKRLVLHLFERLKQIYFRLLRRINQIYIKIVTFLKIISCRLIVQLKYYNYRSKDTLKQIILRLAEQSRQPNIRLVKQMICIVILVGFCLYLNGSSSFLAISNSSMEPTLSRGDLILYSIVKPETLKEGEIIVYKVPKTIQDKYGYPPSLCHRIVSIETTYNSLAFSTKGDATGDDPFIVSPSLIAGKQIVAISFIGYIVLFLQTVQGLIFSGILFLLLFIYWYSAYQYKIAHNLHGATTDKFNAGFEKSQHELEQKIEGFSDQVTQSMGNFAIAMNEYAKHLASHTGAVKSLAQVAEHLEAVVKSKEAEHQASYVKIPDYLIKEDAHLDEIKPIDVTPELKVAVKRFIFDYAKENNLTTMEITSELRAAVWEFIQKYVNEPLPRYSLDQTTQTNEPVQAVEVLNSSSSDAITQVN